MSRLIKHCSSCDAPMLADDDRCRVCGRATLGGFISYLFSFEFWLGMAMCALLAALAS